ncbi:MAG TPA: helix-turn-helix domain-containing protein [Steroidobacteraceae bacterium]|nr:helix-turn-helix domain-containing protein [Steroidobacteraceae bacterium]
MSPLQLLWVNGSVTGSRETWFSQFAAVSRIQEIGISQLTSPEAEGDWDVICFNFDHPEMASLKLVPETKARWPSAPILLLTLQCSADLALWALRARVFDLLVKPLSAQEISRCMQRVVEAAHARRSQSERRPQASIVQVPVEARYRPQFTPSVRLQRAIAHISKHYGRQVPESEVALACEMSPSRFCREFKAAFGVTYVEYLARHRVQEAKRLLGNLSMSVTDVAAAVGFSDPSYFTRVFRRVAGASPTEYRETPVMHADDPEVDPTPGVARAAAL